MAETYEELMARHAALMAAWMETVEDSRLMGLAPCCHHGGRGITLSKNGTLRMVASDHGEVMFELASYPGDGDHVTRLDSLGYPHQRDRSLALAHAKRLAAARWN